MPLLGCDMPFVGRLFRRDVVKDTKNELLVFITPRIMNNQAIAMKPVIVQNVILVGPMGAVKAPSGGC